MGHELCRAPHLADSALRKNLHSCSATFRFQQFNNVLRGTVAEELTERFLVIRDAMLFHQRDEVRGRVAGQRGLCEVFIRGYEIFRLAMNVGEITAPSARDQDLLPDSVGMLQHGDAPPAFAGLDGAEESRCSAAQNQSVKLAHQEEISRERESAIC